MSPEEDKIEAALQRLERLERRRLRFTVAGWLCVVSSAVFAAAAMAHGALWDAGISALWAWNARMSFRAIEPLEKRR